VWTFTCTSYRINTIIGIVQEGSAEKAADALKAMLSSDAVVIRNSKEVKIPAEELVPGDIVKLSLGDRVPADLRMCRVNNLAAQEAALTGESVPIDKEVAALRVEGDPNQQPLGDRNNMCFCATLIAQGSGVGLVVATGDHTEIGTINALVNKITTKKTNVLKQIDTVSKYLAIFISLASVGTWCIAYFITDLSAIDALTTALVCAVAMIPEGLEAIVTMVYAWAVSNMAKKNAIIRALPAVETLGSVTTICSDKTGTLTKNEMTLVALVTSGNRFKFDVHAESRDPTNFVVDNTYMATRADHSKFLSRSEVIRNGPSASRKSRRARKGRTFPFSISWNFSTGHPGVSDVHPDEEDRNHIEEPTLPAEHTEALAKENEVKQEATISESPDATFLRQVLGGGILCSKCVLGEGGGRTGEIGNPTELAILRAAYFGGVDVFGLKESAPIVAEVPFSRYVHYCSFHLYYSMSSPTVSFIRAMIANTNSWQRFTTPLKRTTKATTWTASSFM